MKGSRDIPRKDIDYEEIKRKKQDKRKVINLRKKRKQKDNERNPVDKPIQRR